MTSPILRGVMDYGRLGKSGSTRIPTAEPNPNPNKSKLKILLILTAMLMAACGASAAIAVAMKKDDGGGGASMHKLRPSQAMSRACSLTRYPSLCVDSLLEFPGATAASEMELVNISINVTLQNVGRALSFATELANVEMDPLVRSAHDNCKELLDHSVYLLSRALVSVGKPAGSINEDVLTWLSAALSNQDTCAESLEEVKIDGGAGSGDVRTKISDRMSDLTKFVRNTLNMYADAYRQNFSGVPAQGPRRRLMSDKNIQQPANFPVWMTRQERVLLNTPASNINADIVVSSVPGNGTVRTILEAIEMAPENSEKRFIIHVRAGRYEENRLRLGKKKTNIMLIGDGEGKTVITGGKSVQDHIRTFDTASFAATGDGFIAKDITFENYAGPAKHQAVALRVESDRSVIYQCTILGYQDTLYTRAQRQFYRDCDIHGTVDFIFGNAAAVLQNCTISARKPMPGQENTITAVHRTDADQNTGISIHASRVVAEPDLEAVKEAIPTYMGRPWGAYARAVFMQSYLGDHIDPAGWLAWNGNFGLHTLYYGEYMNSGPGAGLGQRVKWPGYHVITSADEASKFTVEKFILGSTWLPSVGATYVGGLLN